MNKHILNLDSVTGQEYIAGGEDFFTPEFFIENAQETDYVKQYSQLEFYKEYGSCLCTCYGAMIGLGSILQTEFTSDQRLEMVKRRSGMYDFQKDTGGYTSVGVDVVRNFWNELHPDDPVRSALVNDKKLLHKLAQKKIPIVTSIRANKEYFADQKDGTLDTLDYWTHAGKKWGHCRMRKQLEIYDNYFNTYRYKTIDDLELCLKQAVESPNVFLFFREKSLSEKGKVYLQGMKDKLWNGEGDERNIKRQEVVYIAKRLNPLATDLWNGLNGTKDATKFEATTILSKVFPIKVYLGTDRNKPITRGEVIRMIYANQ